MKKGEMHFWSNSRNLETWVVFFNFVWKGECNGVQDFGSGWEVNGNMFFGDREVPILESRFKLGITEGHRICVFVPSKKM